MNTPRFPRRPLHLAILALTACTAPAALPDRFAAPVPARPLADCTTPVPSSGLRWELELEDPAGTAEGVAWDASGDTYVTGALSGTGTDLDPLASRATPAVNLGGSDVFLARYDGSGRLRWSRILGGSGDDIGRSVAVCPDGSVVVAGSFESSAVFGALLWVPLGLASNGGADGFVARYDPDGNLLWVRGIGGPGDDSALDVAVGADGAVYVGGHFSGTARIGTADGTPRLVSRGSYDAFLVRFEADGRLGWARQVGGTSTDVGLGVAVAGDQVLLCGYSRSTVAWAGSLSFGNRGGADAFTAAFRALDGTELQAASYGGEQDDVAYDVGAAPDGGAYVAGVYRGTATFGSRVCRSGGAARGLSSPEAFALRLDPSSNPTWVASTRQSGSGTDSSGLAEAFGVAVSASGCHVYLCGRFVGSVDFDPGTGEAWRHEGVNGYCPVDRGFVWALDRDGHLEWTEVLGGDGVCSANAVAVRGSSRLAVAGMSDTLDSCESTGRAHLFLRSR